MLDPSRRRALGSLFWGGAQLGVAGLWPLSGCAPGISGSRGSLGVRVASLDQLPPGVARRVLFHEEPVIVLNDAGTIRALSGLCTHEACELGWNASQRLIRCPCHGSAFDPNGRVTRGPAVDPLPTFVVTIDRESVYLGAPLGKPDVP